LHVVPLPVSIFNLCIDSSGYVFKIDYSVTNCRFNYLRRKCAYPVELITLLASILHFTLPDGGYIDRQLNPQGLRDVLVIVSISHLYRGYQTN